MQDKKFQINTEEIKKSKNNLISDKNIIYQKKLNEVTANMDGQSKRCTDIIRVAGFPNWLSAVPIKEYSYVLNKQQF